MIYVFNKADLCGMGHLAMIQGADKIYMSAKASDGIANYDCWCFNKKTRGQYLCKMYIILSLLSSSNLYHNPLWT